MSCTWHLLPRRESARPSFHYLPQTYHSLFCVSREAKAILLMCGYGEYTLASKGVGPRGDFLFLGKIRLGKNELNVYWTASHTSGIRLEDLLPRGLT